MVLVVSINSTLKTKTQDVRHGEINCLCLCLMWSRSTIPWWAQTDRQIHFSKAHSDQAQRSVDSAEDFANEKIGIYLSLCGNAIVCCNCLLHATASKADSVNGPYTVFVFQVLNLSNVGAWLGENLEDRDGFVPKTMLCLPIFNGQRDVIGVAQLINKVNAAQDWKEK